MKRIVTAVLMFGMFILAPAAVANADEVGPRDVGASIETGDSPRDVGAELEGAGVREVGAKIDPATKPRPNPLFTTED